MEAENHRMTRLELEALMVALSSTPDAKARELFGVIPSLKVAERKNTGVAFYTTFAPNESLKRDGIDELFLRTHPPEAIGYHPHLQGAVNFLVWIKNGQVDCLEGASSGSWPDDESLFVVARIPD